MKLVIGGAFQGKKEYVKKQFAVSQEAMIDGKDAEYQDIFTCACIYHFHEWVKKGLEKNWDFENLLDELMKKNPELIVVSNELGYGVVPVSAFDRKYRECTGRICTRLAEESQQVIRVVCGLGTVIKDA